MWGGRDLNRAIKPPADAELFEFEPPLGHNDAPRLAAVGIRSRTLTEHGLALLVPGYTGSREDFYNLLGPLADRGFAVVAYSQRGQLGSTGPGDFGPCSSAPGYAIDDFVSDLLRVATELSGNYPQHRIHLLGHSFGGLVGSAALIKQPATFASYTHWNSGPRSRRSHEEHLLALESGGSAALWGLLQPDADLSNPETQWLHARMLATTSGNLWGGARILLDQIDDVDELRKTGVPVLVSHGEFDDIWPHEWQRDMAKRLGASYRVIRGGSHSPQLEEPQACADTLADFWLQHSD